MKLTMVIADDERLALESEKMFIRREFPDIEIISAVRDGLELKKVLEEQQPDLAIVDIRMPGLTGLEVIELAKSKGIHTHFIISTAYSDFEYVRSALNLKTDGYLLKPCKREEHVKAIASMCNIVENEKKEYENRNQVRNAIDVIRPSLEREMLLSVISGVPDEHSFKVYCNLQGFEFYKGCMLVFLPSGGNCDENGFSADDADRNGDFNKRYHGWYNRDYEETCYRTISETLEGWCTYFSSITEDSVIIALLFTSDYSQGNLENQIQEIAGKLKDALERDGRYPFICGIGSLQDSFGKLFQSYSECRNQLANEGEAKLAKEELQHSGREYTELAERYIRTHYLEDIALEDCARYVGISSYYLSHLLKEETGKTFLEQLTALRIGKAKALCMNNGFTTTQIAKMSGYRNTSYFHRVFKKVTGMTISEYRSSLFGTGSMT